MGCRRKKMSSELRLKDASRKRGTYVLKLKQRKMRLTRLQRLRNTSQRKPVSSNVNEARFAIWKGNNLLLSLVIFKCFVMSMRGSKICTSRRLASMSLRSFTKRHRKMRSRPKGCFGGS